MAIKLVTTLRPTQLTGSSRHWIHTHFVRSGRQCTFGNNGNGYTDKNGNLYVYKATKARRYVRRHDSDGNTIKPKTVRQSTVWVFNVYVIRPDSGVIAKQVGRNFELTSKFNNVKIV